MDVKMYGGSSTSATGTYKRFSVQGTSSSTTRGRLAGSISTTTSGTARTNATRERPTDSYSSSYAAGTNGYSTRSNRQLPEGPGPLPNRYSHDRDVRYVSSTHKRDEQLLQRNGYPAKSNYDRDTQFMRRKVSNDSGYGSPSVKSQTGFTSSTSNTTSAVMSKPSYNYSLAGRRSKSFSNIHSTFAELSFTNDDQKGKCASSIKDSSSRSYEASGNQMGYRSNGISSRTKTLESLPKASDTSSVYMQSTSQSDYRASLNRVRNSTNNTSSSSESSSSQISGMSPSTKKSGLILDYNENRRETITALPHALRRSSRSSNSSSSPTSNGHGCYDGLVGLRNLGNTCFMNSILQCLSSTWLLTDHLLKGFHVKNINTKSSMKGKLIQAYADLIKSMWKPCNSEAAISPHSFKTQIQRFAPRFVGYNQQDAQEFLRFLLEGLHDDLNQVHEKPKYKMCEFNDAMSDSEKAVKSWNHYLARDNSLITDVFVGQLKSTLKCTECGYKSVTLDPFWDLSLPIPRKSSVSTYSSTWSSSRSSCLDQGDTHIRDCMELFTREEVLDGDERPTCEKCKKKRKSTKKFTIQRFPKILVLHLKRFSGFSFRSKLQTSVDFPVTKLDLSEFASDSTEGRVYSLYAVSNHSGTTYGGHYTAYCKHPSSQDWHCFNDSRVGAMSATRVRGSQAYILFYEKIDPRSSL